MCKGKIIKCVKCRKFLGVKYNQKTVTCKYCLTKFNLEKLKYQMVESYNKAYDIAIAENKKRNKKKLISFKSGYDILIGYPFKSKKKEK